MARYKINARRGSALWLACLLLAGLLPATDNAAAGNAAYGGISAAPHGQQREQASLDPLYDDSLWEDGQSSATGPSADAAAETTSGSTLELVDRSVPIQPEAQQSLQLPDEADRSIRVSALDDPFDDSEDIFQEPRNENSGAGEANDTDQRPAPPSPDTAPAGSLPSTFKPLEESGPDKRQQDSSASQRQENGHRQENGQRQESGQKDISKDNFSTGPLEPVPGEPADSEAGGNELAKELAESNRNCEEEYTQLRSARIESIDLNIRVAGKPGEDYPYECELGNDRFQARSWPQITYLWKASGLCHKPLYFEQVQLERYGHSWGPYLQPLVSGAHFFASVPILPYKMGLKTPNECVYSLGYYRPGSCAPYLLDPVPFTWRAALFEGGFVVGAAAIIP